MRKITTIHFRPIEEKPEAEIPQPEPQKPMETSKKPSQESLETQKPRKYKNYNIEDTILWADHKIREQFTKPAFGYGEGPFTLLSIRIDPHAPENLDNLPKVANYVLFEIQTPKGKKYLSADYFEKKVGG